MFGIGWQEVIVILLLALLLFGAKRLPEIAKSLGKSVQEFKKGMSPDAKENEEEKKEETQDGAKPK
ncbi:MAG: twin-arginine translocase TatA/TatE family subunit [Endomicrobia bacterium]|jgi:TatA/E family protein of Tat protein translocase|nr:twin-arginine translocase TatA/TatE family subunit [Endomicrobiia bacterium]